MPAKVIKIKFAYTPTQDRCWIYRCVEEEEYKPNPRRNLTAAFMEAAYTDMEVWFENTNGVDSPFI